MNIPNHVAIIMDGNRRWATEKGLNKSEGHLAGSKTLRELVEYAFSNGIKVLSVFAFSTENFNRSKVEVNYLMNLFVNMFTDYFDELNRKGIKIVFSKRESGLPSKLEKIIKNVEGKTKNNKKGIFNICINYGGQFEIVDTIKKISAKVLNKEIDIDDIDKEYVEKNLYQDLPPIDLLIRTSGEYRVSNFMLWQMAYSEFYFTDTYFPDFHKEELEKAIKEFNKRDRRFGKK
ncbi:MAG: di-trans,poly-cis-decaprenylcistransferase [Bacilli bacterium]|nr:di-trans,poly-cis-decaprenylcistransferase [Bacilli bacterium]